MKSKKIIMAFEELKNIIESGPVSSDYKYEERQRRLAYENVMRTYNSFLPSSSYEGTDSEGPSIDNEENTFNDQIIERMNDVVEFFQDLRIKLLESSTRFCKNGAEYSNVIAKTYDLNYIKQDKKTERRINKTI